MKHEGITKGIIGAAIAVLNELKPGLDEKLYENALVIELAARGHTSISPAWRWLCSSISRKPR
jgi:GxxExxY protein